MASDRSVMQEVREDMGFTDTSKVSDEVILQEIDRAKDEINREIHLRLKSGNDIDLYDAEAAVDALKSFVQLRMYEYKDGSVKLPERGVPKTVSELKRTDFPDSGMAERARKVSVNLQRLWN